MDRLIFASLSHTHYWYEVGILKVPAYIEERLDEGPRIQRKHEDDSETNSYTHLDEVQGDIFTQNFASNRSSCTTIVIYLKACVSLESVTITAPSITCSTR